MYGPIKAAVLSLLKVPVGPPDPPAGSHGSARVFRASPRFLQYRMIVLAIVLGVLFLCVAAASAGAMVGMGPFGLLVALPLLALFAFIALTAYFVTRVEYDVRYYIVTDRSLRVREGAWTVKEMTLTYANVQNLRVLQGPIERLLGLSNVAVDTAGGGAAAGQHASGATGHHVAIAGIENAAEVRDLILGHLRARGSGGSGLGDPDDERAGAHRAHGAHGAHGAPSSSPEFAAALRDVRDAARALRAAAEAG